VPGTIRSPLRGQRPIIRSDGHFVRDYFCVEDGALTYTLLAERLAAHPALAGEAFNFSNEEPVSVLDLVDRIRGLMGASLEPEIRNEATHEIREPVPERCEGAQGPGPAPAVRPRRGTEANDRPVQGIPQGRPLRGGPPGGRLRPSALS